MTRVFSRLALLIAFTGLTGCGATIASSNQFEGEVCADYSGGYACNSTGDTILVCDGSNLWRRSIACDQGSACTAATDDDGNVTGLCCTADGEETCVPEPFSINIFPAPTDAGTTTDS